MAPAPKHFLKISRKCRWRISQKNVYMLFYVLSAELNKIFEKVFKAD